MTSHQEFARAYDSLYTPLAVVLCLFVIGSLCAVVRQCVIVVCDIPADMQVDDDFEMGPTEPQASIPVLDQAGRGKL